MTKETLDKATDSRRLCRWEIPIVGSLLLNVRLYNGGLGSNANVSPKGLHPPLFSFMIFLLPFLNILSTASTLKKA